VVNAEIEKVSRKFAALRGALSERARRLWAGAEADSLGRGGVAWVARATGMAISTVRKGRDEVRSGVKPTLVHDRKPGGGRHRLEKKDPGLLPLLDSLVSAATRGDPENPLRWTSKSLRVLAREFKARQHPVSPTKLGELLKESGYSLQAAAKTKEGSSHPDRDAQFAFINDRAKDFMARGLPVVSVDAKKKELVGDHADRAREWQPKGQPIEVSSHEFFESNDPKATPYGVYDVGKNVAYVNVGTSNNTPSFAVRSIEKWWDQMGTVLYPEAKEIFITADAGGSNSLRSKVWKSSLQALADRTQLNIHVSHFPPGTSKWNKIEHRLFSFITLNWRGRLLANYETVIALIAATTTDKGLKVTADLDRGEYPLGKSVEPEQMARLFLELAPFHGDWNYVLRPRTEAQIAEAQTASPAKPKRITHAERNKKWKKLIFEQKQSGMTQREFCKQRGINRGAFLAAHHRLIGKIRVPPRDAK
jgi:hypothetical protein